MRKPFNFCWSRLTTLSFVLTALSFVVAALSFVLTALLFVLTMCAQHWPGPSSPAAQADDVFVASLCSSLLPLSLSPSRGGGYSPTPARNLFPLHPHLLLLSCQQGLRHHFSVGFSRNVQSDKSSCAPLLRAAVSERLPHDQLISPPFPTGGFLETGVGGGDHWPRNVRPGTPLTHSSAL